MKQTGNKDGQKSHNQSFIKNTFHACIMKKMTGRRLILLALIVEVGCTEPYDLPVTNINLENYLIVEGNIDAATGTGFIRLSHPLQLNDESSSRPVSDAKVEIETGSNTSFVFWATDSGNYYNYNSLMGIDSCRLRITTGDSKIFLSDYVSYKSTPEIDKVSWTANDEGLHIYVSTHDDNNKTKYYRWEYEETAEYYSYFQASYIFDAEKNDFVRRNDIYRCWKTTLSNNVLIGNSNDMAGDIISNQHLLTVPSESWKHQHKYSINVRQFALTKEAYQFYKAMKDNNENIGSFFDPVPSRIESNIHCVTHPDFKVIGYFSLSNITEKRIMINSEELPEWNREFLYRDCNNAVEIILPSEEAKTNRWYLVSYLPIPDRLDFVTYDKQDCIDCRIRYGGTNIKPGYWE